MYFTIYSCHTGISWTGTTCDCQSGWTRFQIGCFQRFDTAKTFADAQADCASKNARLAMATEQTYDFVKNLRATGQNYWVCIKMNALV